jgi:hypothetical protein
MTESRKQARHRNAPGSAPGGGSGNAIAHPEMRLVLVDWLDAAGGTRGGWKPVAEMGRDLPVRCRSVGWVVQEDERRIVLVPHLARDGDGDGEIAIPRDWLQRVVDLVEGKGRRRWR